MAKPCYARTRRLSGIQRESRRRHRFSFFLEVPMSLRRSLRWIPVRARASRSLGRDDGCVDCHAPSLSRGAASEGLPKKGARAPKHCDPVATIRAALQRPRAASLMAEGAISPSTRFSPNPSLCGPSSRDLRCCRSKLEWPLPAGVRAVHCFPAQPRSTRPEIEEGILAPAPATIDLTRYIGTKTVRVFRGFIDSGSFDAFHVKLKNIEGVLKKNHKTVPIRDTVGPVKLSFQVPSKGETLLVLDLTVIDLSDHPPRGYELSVKGLEIFTNGKLIQKIPPA